MIATSAGPEIIPDPVVHEVADRVFAYVQPDGGWCLNNAGFVTGSDATVVVDACATSRRTRALLAAIAACSSAPIQNLINTHNHPDHTDGNFVFPASTTIIGHRLCRDAMVRAAHSRSRLGAELFPDLDTSDVVSRQPTLTFDDRITLHVDDVPIELLYVGPAHTPGDIVAWLPTHKVLFCGDLVFNGSHPIFVSGSLVGSKRAIGVLRSFGAEILVPGHGAVGGPELLDRMDAYLQLVEDVSRRGIERSLSPLEAARHADLGLFGEWIDGERFVRNLHRAYADLTGQALDLRQSITDMFTMNGGHPLRCIA